MGLTKTQGDAIISLLSKKVEAKLKRYERESPSLPFLAKLIQNKEQVAAYSFIHSVATMLGMSIYETVSKIIAGEHSIECFTKYDIGGVISTSQKTVIDTIVTELRAGERESDIEREIEEVLQADPSNGRVQKADRIADLYMLRDGYEQFFEIKTVKANIDVYDKSKRKLLEWVARRRKKVKVYLAIPYNPYFPQPYKRFTVQGVVEVGKDLLIGDGYWDYLGGENTFVDLLALFDTVGKLYKEKIAMKIKEVSDSKLGI